MTDPIYADDATGCGTTHRLIIQNVAFVVPQRSGIRMRKNNGIKRELHRFHRRSISTMRAIYQHSNCVHLGHNGATKVGQTDIIVMTSAAGVVVYIICEQHLTNAEIIIKTHHVEGPVERVYAFYIEGNGHFSRPNGLV